MNPGGDDLAKIIGETAEAEIPPRQAEEPLPNLTIDLASQFNCLEQELQELKDTHGLRVSYTKRIFYLVVGWLACVVICVVFSGFRVGAFQLSDSVLIAFITSTTVNVVGLFVLVAKWMFPTGREAASGNDLHSRAESIQPNKKR